MNTINHALWGATIGRFVGLPIEGAIVGASPDVFTLPSFTFYKLVKHIESQDSPKILINIYSTLHNWFFGAGLTAILYFINPRLGVLGVAYLIHIFEDAFLHTDMATRFLYPIWKGKIKVYSANDHKWVQILDFIIIILVNVFYFKI